MRTGFSRDLRNERRMAPALAEGRIKATLAIPADATDEALRAFVREASAPHLAEPKVVAAAAREPRDAADRCAQWAAHLVSGGTDRVAYNAEIARLQLRLDALVREHAPENVTIPADLSPSRLRGFAASCASRALSKVPANDARKAAERIVCAAAAGAPVDTLQADVEALAMRSTVHSIVKWVTHEDPRRAATAMSEWMLNTASYFGQRSRLDEAERQRAALQ